VSEKSRYATKQKGKTEVDPFWNLDDLLNLLNWFKDNEEYDAYLITMFCLLMGRKIGDAVSMRWSDLYEENGDIKTEIVNDNEVIAIAPAVIESVNFYLKKTGRNPVNEYNEFIFNVPCKTHWIERKGSEIYLQNDLEKWCEWLKKDFTDQRKKKIMDDYRSQDKYQTLGDFLYYEVEWNDILKWQSDTYRKILKKAAKKVNIQYKISSHSFRKTFGYISTLIHPKDIDSLEILRSIFQHENTGITKSYIGLADERKRQYYLDMGEVISYLTKKNDEHQNMDCERGYICIKRDDLKQILLDTMRANVPNSMDIVDKCLNLIDERIGKKSASASEMSAVKGNNCETEKNVEVSVKMDSKHLQDRNIVQSVISEGFANDADMQKQMMMVYDMRIVNDLIELEEVDDEVILHAAMEVVSTCGISMEKAKSLLQEWLTILDK
jgi:integrase